MSALDIAALTNDLSATLQMEATLKSSVKVPALGKKLKVAEGPVPGLGLEVKGLFKVGAIVSYEVGVSTSFQGTSVLGFGLVAGVPKQARLVADAVNKQRSGAFGFDAYKSTPNFAVKSFTGEAKLTANTVPKISFGVEVTDIGKVDVDLSLKLPEVTASLGAEYSEF